MDCIIFNPLNGDLSNPWLINPSYDNAKINTYPSFIELPRSRLVEIDQSVGMFHHPGKQKVI